MHRMYNTPTTTHGQHIPAADSRNEEGVSVGYSWIAAGSRRTSFGNRRTACFDAWAPI